MALSGTSMAVSFDCNKANTDTEAAICSDPQLYKLDEVLSELYRLKKSFNFSSEELSHSIAFIAPKRRSSVFEDTVDVALRP